ncbi:MAG: hypothetical protein NTW96_14875, partial [Planctomycetia bacterium]|nr:hypothetical protein [Planctomycetia bacterium]
LEGSGDRYLEFRAIYLRDFPVPDTARSGNDGQTKRDAISELADRMLRLHRHVAETDHGKTVLMREIAATDRKIDQLVYELYGLTDEEICLVEEATTPRQAPPDTTEKKPRQMAMFDQEC